MGNPDNDRDKGGLSEIESPAIIIMALLALGNALASTHYKPHSAVRSDVVRRFFP